MRRTNESVHRPEGEPGPGRRAGRPVARLRRLAAGAVVAGALALAAACGGEGSAAAGESGGADGSAGAEPSARSADPAADSALRAMAAELTPAVESLASLSFRRPPRLARASRETLERFLVAHLEEEWPAERARAVRDAYARLGLVSDTLDLRALLRDLLLEQVVGYYDPAADTLFVRTGVDSSLVRPVVVHELVHALQDQHLDLDSLTDALSEHNDRSAAAQSALEGHATFVMMEWELSRRIGGGVDLARMPDLSGLLGGANLASLAGMPALSGAPEVVRETLLFPYVGGLGMVQALWRARSDRPAPMGRWMPTSTEQVIHPGRLLSEPPDAPTEVRFRAPPEGWREVHADALGELEMRVWLGTHLADSARARSAAAGWDGDRYRLLRGPEGREALAWVTVWDGPDEADDFRRAAEQAYERLQADRPGRRHEIRRREVGGRPAVTIWDGPSDLPAGMADRALRFRLEGGG